MLYESSDTTVLTSTIELRKYRFRQDVIKKCSFYVIHAIGCSKPDQYHRVAKVQISLGCNQKVIIFCYMSYQMQQS